MTNTATTLFSPVKLGDLELPNRFVNGAINAPPHQPALLGHYQTLWWQSITLNVLVLVW